MQRLHGMGEALYDWCGRCPVPGVCACGDARGPAGLSGAPAAGERRQHQLRAPPGRSVGAGGGDRRRSRGAAADARCPRQSAYPPAARSLSGSRNSAGLDLADRATAPALLAAMRWARRATTIAQGPRGDPEPGRPSRPCRCDRRCGSGGDRCGTRRARRGWRAWDMAAAPASRRGAGARRRSDRGVARGIAVPAGARRRQDVGRRYRGSPRGGGSLPLVRRCSARKEFAAPRELPGPTGERNTWALGGRGVFASISPWNFPLAIFTGQVAAALRCRQCGRAPNLPSRRHWSRPARSHCCSRRACRATVPALLPGDGTVGGRW